MNPLEEHVDDEESMINRCYYEYWDGLWIRHLMLEYMRSDPANVSIHDLFYISSTLGYNMKINITDKEE